MSEFRIQQCLGRGGFGEVYKAVMSRGGGVVVDVAIKVLRPDLDPDSQGVKRLKDEGNLLGRLTHPTILRVYGMVEVEGRSALVTEYVAGDDLGRLIRTDAETVEPGSGIPARAAFEIIAQVAAALDAAWSWPSVSDGKPFHLVHRDIKPDNIRIDPHGSVKLLDFGISLASSVRREAHTSVNTIMGSTQYLAPERLVMQEVGPESDVFALGCSLFEALTGEALFARKSMRQMYMLMVDEHRFDEFVTERCTACRGRLGGDRVVALVRAMTAWRKQNRPTAAEVAARCDMISDSTPGLSLTHWCRNRRWPPAPTIEGPLEGHSFIVSQPLAEDAETHSLRPPAMPDRVQTRANQEETSGPLVGPRADDTTDARLRTEEARPSILGELGHDPSTDETKASRSAAAEGPLPWSEAETVALWAEHEPTRPIEREEVTAPAIDTRRLPQLLRQHPGESPLQPELLPEGTSFAARSDDPPTTTEAPVALVEETVLVPTGPSLEEVAEPAPSVDDVRTAPVEAPTDPGLPAAADEDDDDDRLTPLTNERLPGLLESTAPTDDGGAPPVAPSEPLTPGLTLEPVAPPERNIEEPTVRLQRRPSHTGLRVGTARRERVTPLGGDGDPVTGPILDAVAEPTLRLSMVPEERTMELPDGQEATLPGFGPEPFESETGPEGALDEVHRPLGPEPVESSDPDEANTDADGMPVGRELRSSERDLLELPPTTPPGASLRAPRAARIPSDLTGPDPVPVPDLGQTPAAAPVAAAAASAPAPAPAPAAAPGSDPTPAPRRRRQAPALDKRRLLAGAASSFAGLVLGMVLLLVVLLIGFALR